MVARSNPYQSASESNQSHDPRNGTTPKANRAEDQAAAEDAAKNFEDHIAGPAAAQRVIQQLQDLQAYARYLAQVKVDAAKLAVRKLLIMLALGTIGGIVALTALCYAAILVLSGTAEGVAVLVGGHAWAGQLITGFTLMLIVMLSATLVIRRLTKTSFQGTLDKYTASRSDSESA